MRQVTLPKICRLQKHTEGLKVVRAIADGHFDLPQGTCVGTWYTCKNADT